MSKFFGLFLLTVSTIIVPLSGFAAVTLIETPEQERARMIDDSKLRGDYFRDGDTVYYNTGRHGNGDIIIETEPLTTAVETSPRPISRDTAYEAAGYEARRTAAYEEGYSRSTAADTAPDIRLSPDAPPGTIGSGGGGLIDARYSEQKAYQVSGVTFYGETSAIEASRLTGAPIREVWVDDVQPVNGTASRIDNSRSILAHQADILDVNFTSSFVSKSSGSVGRADVMSAGGLVSQAQMGVSRAQAALSRAQSMPSTMGSVKAAAIAEAEQAVKDAEEALRLAQEALEKAMEEMEEDAESDSDTDE